MCSEDTEKVIRKLHILRTTQTLGVISRELTWYEWNFAEHNPFRCEVQLKLYEASDAMMKLNRDITCMLHDGIGHVCEMHWLAVVVLTADAEVCLCKWKYLLWERMVEKKKFKHEKSLYNINISSYGWSCRWGAWRNRIIQLDWSSVCSYLQLHTFDMWDGLQRREQ